MRWSQRKANGKRASLDIGTPLRRSEDLVVEPLDDELLVYDRTNKRAHCLSATAARVWRACDGSTDVTAMSAELGLPPALVREALDELDASRLLDRGLELVKVGSDNGNGNAVTRRELAARSAKVGAAVATAPLILSITAPTAMAAATPTPFQCHVYTVQGCGTSTGCGSLAGCCCCCQGGGSCKLCSSTSFCNAGLQPCTVEVGGTLSQCSTIGSGDTPSIQGCCSVSGASQCGCAYAPGGIILRAGGGGGAAAGAGCCNQHTGVQCTPSSTDPNCVPCCNGQILQPGSPFGCCTPGAPGTDTCQTTPPS